MGVLTQVVTGDRYDPRYSSEEYRQAIEEHLHRAVQNGIFRQCGLETAYFDISIDQTNILVQVNCVWANSTPQLSELTQLQLFSWLIDRIIQEYNRWDYDGLRWYPHFSWGLVLKA